MTYLQVNVDHVATVRQARGAVEPDPVHAAVLAELAGASGITIHLREDRRHIQDRDLDLMKQAIRTRLNLEMAATEEMVRIACQVRPYQVTLVPEKRQELTTEGGLDVIANQAHVKQAVQVLKEDGRVVSLFVDPSREQILASREVGADAVELHTGRYADAGSEADQCRELEILRAATSEALNASLIVHAGHGLTYQNTAAVAAIAGIADLNIGHSIISRAVLTGIDQAVRDMLSIIAGASRPR